MSRGSKKPCPGCGKIRPDRPAKEVCAHCKRLIERATWLETELSKVGNDEIIVRYGIRYYQNEYIHTHSDSGRTLMRLFQSIAVSGSRISTSTDAEFELLGKIDNYGFGGSYAVMSRSLAEAIRDLRIAVVSALKSEYEEGKKDGHNLLVRLASGELSMSDFDTEVDRECK